MAEADEVRRRSVLVSRSGGPPGRGEDNPRAEDLQPGPVVRRPGWGGGVPWSTRFPLVSEADDRRCPPVAALDSGTEPEPEPEPGTGTGAYIRTHSNTRPSSPRPLKRQCRGR